MTLFSIEFILFFIAVLVVYYIVPGKIQWMVLLAASVMFFLLSSIPHTFIFLIVSILTIWFASNYIGHLNSEIEGMEAQGDGIVAAVLKKKRKTMFVVTVVINIGMLAALKYTNFFLENVQMLVNAFGSDLTIGAVRWLAPLGISFYTLQVVGYLTDVYWGISKPQKNVFKFALFTSYFPQITSGPISRYSQLENQLFARHAFDFKTVCRGAARMAWGFFKKLVIADRVGILANAVYADPAGYPGMFIWLGTFAYVLQLYADFSGSMDIVLGASECMGIRLPENFRTPFFSRTIQEFWQRWHITLGQWLRDYIMYPVSRSRAWAKMGRGLKKRFGKKAAQRIPSYLAMLVLWVAIGIWHGNGWQFVAQGLWFWVVIVAGQLLAPAFKKTVGVLKIQTETFSWHLFQSIRTFLIFAVGVLFFGSGSLPNALYMIKSGLTVLNPTVLFSEDLVTLAGGQTNLQIIAFGVIMLFVVGAFQAKGISVRDWLGRQNAAFRWIVLYGLVFCVILLGLYGPGYNPTDFIYGRF